MQNVGLVKHQTAFLREKNHIIFKACYIFHR